MFLVAAGGRFDEAVGKRRYNENGARQEVRTYNTR